MIGNVAAEAEFVAAMAAGTVHHAWLIAGPEGIGKARFARAAAIRLLAQAADRTELNGGFTGAATARTTQLIAAGAHPDYREIRRLAVDPDKPEKGTARSIRIDQVRALGAMLATKPALSDRRVIVIDAVDDVERPGASNALLKNLEEPPAGTIFLLVSHAPGRLLPTIRSRCRLLRFDPLPDGEVAEVLRAELVGSSEEEIAALAAVAGGSPGRALRFAGLDIGKLDAELDRLITTGDADAAIALRLSGALGGKAAQERYEAFLERAPALIARAARTRRGAALTTALDAYDEARSLSRTALALSLDPGTTSFEMAGIVARLADGAPRR